MVDVVMLAAPYFVFELLAGVISKLVDMVHFVHSTSFKCSG